MASSSDDAVQGDVYITTPVVLGAPLRDAKKESLAQLIAAGAPPDAAHRQVYGKMPEGSRMTNARACFELRAASPELQKRIRSLRNAILETRYEEGCELDEAWVLDRLRENVRRCLQSKAAVGKDGEVVEYRFNPAGANKSLELIGKYLGMFAADRKREGLESQSEQELLDDLRGLREEVGELQKRDRPSPGASEEEAAPVRALPEAS